MEPDTTVKKKSIMMRKIGASVIFAAVSFFWLGFSYVFAANLFGDDIGKSPEEYELFVPVGYIGFVVWIIGAALFVRWLLKRQK